MFNIGLGVTITGVVILVLFAIYVGLKGREVRVILPYILSFTVFGITLMVTSLFY